MKNSTMGLSFVEYFPIYVCDLNLSESHIEQLKAELVEFARWGSSSEYIAESRADGEENPEGEVQEFLCQIRKNAHTLANMLEKFANDLGNN